MSRRGHATGETRIEFAERMIRHATPCAIGLAFQVLKGEIKVFTRQQLLSTGMYSATTLSTISDRELPSKEWCRKWAIELLEESLTALVINYHKQYEHHTQVDSP